MMSPCLVDRFCTPPRGVARTVESAASHHDGEKNSGCQQSSQHSPQLVRPAHDALGALVDLAGQVVGIPTLAATDQQFGGGATPGIGFAISSNTATLIARQLAGNGKVTSSGRAALGVQVSTVDNGNGAPARAGARIDGGQQRPAPGSTERQQETGNRVLALPSAVPA
jgi:hypothetical protein